ncbi:MAG: hypothetical protein ACRD9W_22765 [Terriglobia bacterium]
MKAMAGAGHKEARQAEQADARRVRLDRALKANLAKRKAQARARLKTATTGAEDGREG